jgi:hypothetical protein
MPDALGMKRRFIPLFFFVCGAAAPAPKSPDCSGPDHYAAGVAFATLKNAGAVTNENVDFSGVKSTTIVSQRIGKDLWRQVFRVTFPLKSGSPVEALVVSDASSEECSMSDPQIFLVSRTF